MMRATPQDAADTEPDFTKADECYAELKRRVRPGFWGELALRVSVENGVIRLTRIDESKVVK